MRFRLRLVFTFLLPSLFFGAEQARSLGSNLDYVRVHTLPDDLPPASSPRPHPLVLDLRFVKANQEATTAFLDWVAAQAKPASPLFVLINVETAPALRTALARKSPAGLISVGSTAGGVRADVGLEVSAAKDREGYDALEHGASLESLVNPKLDKTRHDEAAAAKERSGTVEPEATPVDDVPLPAPKEKTKEEKAAETPPPPPVDPVLQRAVQVHRALVALRKI